MWELAASTHPGRFLGYCPHRARIYGGCGGRQCTVDLQGPHLFERAGAGQFHRVVLPIMKKSLPTSHRAEFGIRYRQSL